MLCFKNKIFNPTKYHVFLCTISKKQIDVLTAQEIMNLNVVLTWLHGYIQMKICLNNTKFGKNSDH